MPIAQHCARAPTLPFAFFSAADGMGGSAWRGHHVLLAVLVLLAHSRPSVADVDGDVLSSLRRALRDKDTAHRTERRQLARAADGVRQLDDAASSQPRRRTEAANVELCSSGDCRIDLTTGIAGWRGAGAMRADSHWAYVDYGSCASYPMH